MANLYRAAIAQKPVGAPSETTSTIKHAVRCIQGPCPTAYRISPVGHLTGHWIHTIMSPILTGKHHRFAGEWKTLRIYVGNFAYELREQELLEAFEAYGQVQEVSIVKDRDTGRSKGFAFVEMPAGTEALAAIGALNGKELGGRAITVNEARPRAERGSTGGGGYGGNRGGGGRAIRNTQSSGSRSEGRSGSRGGGGGFHNARKHPPRTPRE